MLFVPKGNPRPARRILGPTEKTGATYAATIWHGIARSQSSESVHSWSRIAWIGRRRAVVNERDNPITGYAGRRTHRYHASDPGRIGPFQSGAGGRTRSERLGSPEHPCKEIDAARLRLRVRLDVIPVRPISVEVSVEGGGPRLDTRHL